MSDQVPFGKYKGRPVEEMLSDASYMAWLEAQPWFRERFGHLKTAKDNDALSRTPVHNKLQTLFLDINYQHAFLRAAAPEEKQRIENDVFNRAALSLATLEKEITKHTDGAEEYQQKIDALQDDTSAYMATHLARIRDNSRHSAESAAKMRADLINSPGCIWKMNAQFEAGGADVLISCRYVYFLANSFRHGVSEDYVQYVMTVEIKPTVADEYPAVLRQMNRNKSEFLFVEEYTGEGATESQFVQIFAASGKKVVFKRDVDALLK